MWQRKLDNIEVVDKLQHKLEVKRVEKAPGEKEKVQKCRGLEKRSSNGSSNGPKNTKRLGLGDNLGEAFIAG